MARRSRAAEDAVPAENAVSDDEAPIEVASEATAPAVAPKARRGRPARVPQGADAESGDTAPIVRRRRRRRVVDVAAQNGLLIAAMLKARGSQGAAQAELLKVSLWARSVHDETTERAFLAKRPRLRRGDTTDRLGSAELNRLLLDGVLAGSYSIDVNDAGELVFGGMISSG